MAVYTIPFSQPFLQTLVDGILERYAHDSLLLSQTVVLLPTQRGCLNLKAAFRQRGASTHSSPSISQILPKIIALADLEQTPHLPGFIPPSFPPEMPRLEKLGLLSQMVMAYGKQKIPMTVNRALQLAEDLLSLLDEIHTSDVDPCRLQELVGQDFAHHWQITLDFLKIITEHWPLILEEKGFMDGSIRRRENLRLIAKQWHPQTPVILAGTTGTRPATADLAFAIHQFPQGHLILPGYLPDENAHHPNQKNQETQEDLFPSHPQYTLQQFVRRLGAPSIYPWVSSKITSSHEFSQDFVSMSLIQKMMMPTFEEIIPLPPETVLPFRFIACQDRSEESLVIAMLIRQLLEEDPMRKTEQGPRPHRTIAVITPDQELTRRLKSQLNRWGIAANTSSGTPLPQSVVGTFLTLLGRVHEKMDVVSWLSLLKHPLFYKHRDRGMHLSFVRRLDLYVRRRHSQDNREFPFVPAWFQDPEQEAPERFSSFLSSDTRDWYLEILQILSPLFNLSGKISLLEWLETLTLVAEQLCAPEKLWTEADGVACSDFIEELREYAHAYPKGSSLQFSSLFPQLLKQQMVHDPKGIGSPVLILGALEARQYQADITILAGLNEGIWPKGIDADPWLNLQMRLDLGLPDPQRRIGLSAHDFCLAFSGSSLSIREEAGNPCVYLTRSVKDQGTVTMPSRWWLRLETLLTASGIDLPYETELLKFASLIDHPRDGSEVLEALCPCPPLDHRPLTYSVTDLELLRRDPYSFYAKRILQLKKLESLDQELEARDFGQYVHQALDLFQKQRCGDDPMTLMRCGHLVFQPIIDDAFVQQFWWPRFEQIVVWLEEQWSKREDHRDFQVFTEQEFHHSFEIDKDGKKKLVLLKTIVDRLEIDEHGHVWILDYKTGILPTQKDIYNGFSPQLPLEAFIVQNGESLMSKQRVISTSLEYWHLKGGQEGGEIRPLRNSEELMELTQDGVKDLLRYFLLDPTPYLSCPWGESMLKNPDYRQLARIPELIR